MYEAAIMTDAEIDTFVDDMDRTDIALAIHVQRVRNPNDPILDLLETRAAILRWCADPKVARCFNEECVRATAAAVHAMTPPEFSDYVGALEYLVHMVETRARGVA